MRERLLFVYKWFEGEVLAIPGRVIAGLFLLALILLPVFTSHTYILQVVVLTSIFAIYAVSWDVLAGFTGQVSLGHALFLGVGAYTAGMLNTKVGLPPWVTIPCGGVAAVLVGSIVGLPALRLRGLYLSLVSLGFPIILSGIILIFPDFTGGEFGIGGISRLSSSGIVVYYIVCWIMIASVYLMYKLSDAESRVIRIGVVLHAIREDEITARASGINTTRYKLFAFGVSGFFAGIAGGLYAHVIRIAGPSTLELLLSFYAILWCIFGGVATIYGAVAGTFILYPLVEFIRIYQIGEHLRFVVLALLLIIVLLFMPEGLSLWVRDKIEVQCPRCKLTNMMLRQTCRACSAFLHLTKRQK
jgi:branched-chain amino acid transport system permease protein